MRTASLLTDRGGGGGVGMGGSIMVPPFTELLAKDSTSPPPPSPWTNTSDLQILKNSFRFVFVLLSQKCE